jgi:hypothetical protein
VTDQCKTRPYHPAAVPIVVGVTGHRDLPGIDRPGLAAKLRVELSNLQDRFPSTPVVAMSSLAEGADRLFAECALGLGMQLYVPLPLALEEYERDFADESSIDTFRGLCARATEVFTVPHKEILQQFTTDATLWRKLRYACAGFYIAQRCHVLYALWDGLPARGIGGTGQIVAVRTNGNLESTGQPPVDAAVRELAGVSPLSDPDLCVVRWLQVRRSGSSPESGTTTWLPQADGGEHSSERVFKSLAEIDSYNAELRAGVPTPQPTTALAGGVALSKSRYEAADKLAGSNVKRMRRRIRQIFLLAFLSVCAHEAYNDIWPQWEALSAYLLGLGAVGLFAWGLRIKHLNPRAIDYRALAEALRIQYAWELAGVANSVAHHYLRRDAEQLIWVRHALVGVALVPPRLREQNLVEAQTEWVKGQCDYFQKSVPDRSRAIKVAQGGARFLFWGGIVAALAVLGNHLRPMFPMGHDGITLVALSLAMSLLPATAALFTAYVEFGGLEDDVREHRRMHSLFERANHKMYGATETEQQKIVLELGVEALNENAYWAVAHKSREPKAPAG